MCEPSSSDREQVAETFAELRASLRAERRRTVAERRAFETFADRVDDVEFAGANPDTSLAGGAGGGHGATVVSAGRARAATDDPTERIRRAYEETVMSISFYDEEYGDDYVESLRAEFGPAVATALTDPGCVGPATKTALTAATERAVREREQLVETCEREREFVDDAADTLQPIAAELDGFASPTPERDPFGTLEARWNRLAVFRERCETAAADRQAAIKEQRSRHDLPVDAPDICAYFYESQNSAYPVLALCTELAQRATALQAAYERAMARY